MEFSRGSYYFSFRKYKNKIVVDTMPEQPNDKKLKKIITDLIQRGLIAKTNDKYILTESGWKAVKKIDRENIERVLKNNN